MRKNRKVGVVGIKSTEHLIRVSTAFVLAIMSMMIAPPQNLASEEYNMPGAITAEPDKMLRKAWRLFHDRQIRTNTKDPRAEAAILLKMRDAEGPKVSDDTLNTSFAYRLLVAKMPARYGKYHGKTPAGNVALRHFDAGVSYLYRQLNIPARRAFAIGIFASAHLGDKDYKVLQKAGINVQYDKEATMEVNAINLADIFVGADLKKKEKMLRVVVDKFSGVEAKNTVTDWNHPAYRLKGAYWNLGFFISAHWLVGNSSTPDDKRIMQEAVDMRGTKGWAHNTLWLKFKYHTSDDDMF